MKIPTVVIIAKAFCFVLIGALTPLAASLAQWANSGELPPRIVWIVILSGCAVGGATQLLSFLSSAYSDYVQTRSNGNGSSGPGPTAVAASKPSGQIAPPLRGAD
jgi:hypothetical protein